MFSPPFLGLKLPDAPLAFVDESLWQPATATGFDIVPWGADVGVNVGTLFTVTTNGTLHSLCYYRGTAAMAPNGSLALWKVSDFGGDLLARVDFTDHSGTGWVIEPLDEPIELTPSEAYQFHLWIPAVDAVATLTFTYTYFQVNGHYSTPNTFLYAQISNGQLDPRGFLRRNGFATFGAFARPADIASYSQNFWLDGIFNARPLYIPPLPPMIMKWDIPAGWPDADTTGPDPETVFDPPVFEMFNSTSDGQVIENQDLRAGLTIKHPNVIVRNCKIIGVPPNVVYMEYGTADNCLIEDCLIDGVGRYNAGIHGITVGSPNCTVQRCNIHRVENGLNVFGQVDCSHIFRDNFIHHLLCSPPVPAPHYDGMQMDGYIVNVLIEHNTVMNEKDDTSALMLDNLGGPIDNVIVKDNYLCGGGYTLYLDGRLWPIQPITNVSYFNNLLRPGKFGYYSFQGLSEQPTMSGNQFLAQGGVYDAEPAEGFTVGQSVVESLFGFAPNTDAAINEEPVDAETGGLNLGVAFQMAQDGQITSLNFRRPGNSSTHDVTIGLWRFTGSTLGGGVELLGTRVFTDIIATGVVNFAFEAPIDVAEGDNLLAGVFVPRGPDGKCWYFSGHGTFWPDHLPSQFERFTAFNNSASVPLNGFQGGNGLYAYGPALAPPISRSGSDASYDVDPVFVADWTEADVPVDDTTVGDATNTGVPDGTVLSASGDITTSINGQIIEDKHVSGTITINHNNCIVRRCLVETPEEANSKGINCWGSNTLVEDCEVVTTIGYIAIEGEGTFRRLHIHGWENGFSITGGHGGGIYNSYVHDMQGIEGGHRDCIQIDGNVDGFTVAYNTLDNQYDETSCVMIDNYWGPINNIIVHDNVMIGGGSYTVYSDGQFAGGPVTNVQFIDNRMDEAQFGYHSFNSNTPVWTGNTDRISGDPIP